MTNPGKVFEDSFRKSCPDDMLILRMNDGGGWSNSTTTRFTSSNICDFLLFTGYRLFMLELKSLSGKSLPLQNIRENQIKGLLLCGTKPNVKAGFIINFRDINETYYLPACEVEIFQTQNARKSIPLDYVREFGVLVPQKLIKVKYRYDFSFVKEVK